MLSIIKNVLYKLISATLLSVLFLLIFQATQAFAVSGVVGSGSSITSSTQSSMQRHIVKTSEGTLHAFIQAGTITSTCGGSSKSGLLWFTSSDSGSTWTCAGQLSSDTTNQMFADAKVDASDNIYVTFSVQTTSSNNAYDLFYVKISKGSGSTWTMGNVQTVVDAVAASGTSRGFSYSAIELQGSTRAWIATRRFDGTNYQVSVYYSDGLTDAPTWTTSIATLDTAGTSSTAHYPAIARYGSKIGVFWTDNSTNALNWRYRSDSDSVTSWATAVQINSSMTASSPLYSVVGTTNGKIFAVLNAASSVYLAYYNGSYWVSNVDASGALSGGGVSVTTDGESAWIYYFDTTNITSTLSGSRKLVYKKCSAPFTSTDCDSSATSVNTYHGFLDKYWSFVSSSYLDDTTDAGNSTINDTQMISSATNNDAAYFGKTEKFDGMSWLLQTAGVGGTATWEYCSAVDGSNVCTTWSSLSLLTTSNSNLTGSGYVTFTAPSDWVASKVNTDSSTFFYIRAKAATNYSTVPIGTQIVSMPQINWPNTTALVSSNSTYVLTTENAASTTRIRSAVASTTGASSAATTAETGNSVVAYSTSVRSTYPNQLRHMVKTSDGTLHQMVPTDSTTPIACGGTTTGNYGGLVWLMSTDNGYSWSCQGQLTSSTGFVADVKADSNDNLYVVYSNVTSGASTTADAIYRKFTKGTGPTWTMGAAQIVFDGISTEGFADSSIEIEGTTRAWIAVQDETTTTYQLKIKYSDGLTDAPTWTDSLSTSTSASNTDYNPALVRFGGDKIAVIYANSGLKWRYRSDSDGLTSWSSEAQLTGSSLSVAVTNISAVGDASNLYVAVGSSTNVLFSYWNGSSWSANATVSSAYSNAQGNAVNVIADPTGVYVMYMETTGLSSAMLGSRKLVYKHGVSPYAAANFDANSTALVSRHATFDKVWLYDTSANSYCDDTTDAGDSNSTNTSGTNCSSSVTDVGHSDSNGVVKDIGDVVYFGKSEKFDAISYDLSTSGTSGKLAWEYWNGTSWSLITTWHQYGARFLTADGFITFMPHSDWTATSINGEGSTYYYIRARVVTAYVTAPTAVQFSAIPPMWGATAISTANSSADLNVSWTEGDTTGSQSIYRVRNLLAVSSNNLPTVSSLGPSGLVDGSTGTNNQPQFNFTTADADGSDTVKYQIQIDDSSNFSSPVVDYTSALAATGAKSFTVGQAAGTGTYTTGSSGQTLGSGNYYWRVRGIDSNNGYGGYTYANSGGIAFVVDSGPPTTPGTPSTITPTDGQTPTWTWTASTDTGGLGSPPYTVEWSQDAGFGSGVSTDTAATNSYTHSTNLAAGTWYFRVKAVDNSNNYSSYSSNGTVVIDLDNPSTPGRPTTVSPSSNQKPTWSWTASTDSTTSVASYAVQWSQDSSFLSGVTSNTSSNNFYTNPSNLAEGTWYFRAAAIDAVGNQGSYSSAGSVVIDITNPTTPGTPSTTTPTSTLKPTWTWTASTDAVGLATTAYTVQWSQDNTFGSGVSSSTSSTNSFTHASNLTAGTWYFRAKANDSAGNSSSYSSYGTVVVDTAAPTGLGTPSATSPTNSSSQLWTWTGASDALSGLAYYAWRITTSLGSAVASGTTTLTSYTSSLAEGAYIFYVKAVDNVGNQSSENAASITVDTTAPSTTDNVDSSWHQSFDVSLTCADSDGSGCLTTYYTLDGSTPTNSSTQGTDFSLSSTGIYTLKYYSVDTAGNEESVKTATNTIKIDADPPTDPGTPSSFYNPTNNLNPTVTWSDSTDADSGLAATPYQIEWSQDLAFGSGVTTDTTSATSYDLPLTEGTWYVRVKAIDQVGNASSYASNSLVVDATPPTDPGTPVASSDPTDNTPTWVWTSSNDWETALNVITPYTVEWTQDPSFVTDVVSSTIYTNEFTHDDPLADGTWYFRVKAEDAAGNYSSFSPAGSITIDTTAPITPGTPTTTTPTSNQKPAWAWTASTDSGSGLNNPAYTVEWSQDSGFSTASTSTTDTNSFTQPTNLSTGQWYFRVKATDNYGNESSYSSNGSVLIDITAPTAPGTPSTSSPTSNVRPTWTWTASTDSGSGLGSPAYSVQWSQSASFSSGNSSATAITNTFTHGSDLAAGTWYFRVKAVDAVNNQTAYSSAGTVVIDTSGPTTPGTPSTTSPTTDSTPTWTWTASTAGAGLANPAYTVEWSQDSLFLSGVTTTTTNASSFTHVSTLSDGTWYFRVKSVDLNGTYSSYSSNGTVVIDTTNPTAPGTPSTTSPTNLTTQNWVWSSATDATSGVASYIWRVTDSLNNAVTNGTSLTTSAITNLTQGIYHFFVKSQDAVGNQSSESSGSVTVDTTTPTPTPSPTVSEATAATCTDSKPQTPELKELTTNGTSVTVTFRTLIEKPTKYLISFGINEEASRFEKEFEISETDRNMSEIITDNITPGTTYYFKVKAFKGCKSGDYSDTKSIAVETSALKKIFSFVSSVVKPKTEEGSISASNESPTSETSETSKTIAMASPATYSIDVKVVQDGKPVGNTEVLLHSKVQTGKTNEQGIVHFDNVEPGDHTILLAYNGDKLEQKVKLEGEDTNKVIVLNVNAPTERFSKEAIIIISILGGVILILLVGLYVIYRRKISASNRNKFRK